MHRCVLKILFFWSSFVIHFSCGTIDINLAEFQYIADHLTEKECLELNAALHFRTFEIPKDINAAERRLPEGIPCIDLLLHWNSTPREGKGQTHVEVSHRLSQLGREDLAQWLSKTVFHQISKDLNAALTASATEETTLSIPNITDINPKEEILDEAAWRKVDSILAIFAVIGLVMLIFGSFFLCFLCCTRKSKTVSPRLKNEKCAGRNGF